MYAFDQTHVLKQEKALLLLADRPTISSQVIIETHLACSRKLKLPMEVCDENSLMLADIIFMFAIGAEIIHKAV